MAFRRRMLGDRRVSDTWQRWSMFGLILASVIVGPAFASPEPHVIRVGASTADAAAADGVGDGGDVGHSGRLTAASFRDIWVAPASPTSWQEVQYVQPPAGIPVGEPLLIEVNVTDDRGRANSNALVEITLELPGGSVRTTGRTNAMGRVTTRRLLPLNCKGQRCIVAVRVVTDQLERFAYSAFIPQ